MLVTVCDGVVLLNVLFRLLDHHAPKRRHTLRAENQMFVRQQVNLLTLRSSGHLIHLSSSCPKTVFALSFGAWMSENVTFVNTVTPQTMRTPCPCPQTDSANRESDREHQFRTGFHWISVEAARFVAVSLVTWEISRQGSLPFCTQCSYLGDLEARQLAILRAGEAVHGVGADFECELPSVQHLLPERVRLFLQVRLRPERTVLLNDISNTFSSMGVGTAVKTRFLSL